MTTNNPAKEVLILGTNQSGLQATLDLADAGVPVHLVESAPFVNQSDNGSISAHEMRTRILEIARHPKVTLWTNTDVEKVEDNGNGFQIALRQNPRFVDLARCTACGECIDVCPVTVPGTDHKVIYLDGQPGCMAIDKMGQPPCSNVCPGGIHVQGYIALIAQGRFQEAIDLIREAIPFPGICGRVCTHPCEINCRRTEIDNPVSARLLKRFVADWEIEQRNKAVEQPRNKGASDHEISNSASKVAVVGAGPGGMAVADRLARKGYGVTVFEKLPVIGGMMAVGIPSYRLPREIIAHEYQQIQDLGVEIKLNTSIGPDGDHTMDELFEMGFDAVCLAVGAHKSQSLGIPGEDLPGVVHGIEALKTISLIRQHDDVKNEIDLLQILRQGTNTRIAVLGGGNTAIDVARSLKRYNVKNVRILYRRTRAEMPAMPEEVEDAEKEGIELDLLVSPVRVLGDQTHGVTGLECIRMELGEPDSSGRRRPVPIEGSEFVIDLDLVVLAIGQKPDLEFIEPKHGISITDWQHIEVNEDSFITSRPGVFAVGDVVSGADMVVIEAIGMGKKAAQAIEAYLQGQDIQDNIPQSSRPVSNRDISAAEMGEKPRISVPTISIEKRISSYSEVELGFSSEQAIAEAQRCLACGPCSECQACVQVCEPGAIIHNQHAELINLEVGAVLNAEALDENFAGDAIYGSAQAHRVYMELFPSQRCNGSKKMETLPVGEPPWKLTPAPGFSGQPDRSGVFICQCGLEDQGQISSVIDTQSIRSQASSWPGVIHAQTIDFACSPEGSEQIDQAVKSHNLNRIVLAACSCCSIDQICFSCSYQRVRCKENLHLFTHPERSSAMGTVDKATKFVLVNIREQCAWVHADDPIAATSKATNLIAGSVARAMATPSKLNGSKKVIHSALIIGSGKAAKECLDQLNGRGIETSHIDEIPGDIGHEGGQYRLLKDGQSWQASALVMAPKNKTERTKLLKAFGKEERQPNLQPVWGGLDTQRPGVYIIEPALDPLTAAAAASARVAAWLGRAENHHTITSIVNTSRCRGCGTCGEICEFGAPILIKKNGDHVSWIDPLICTGCGTCVAHCPSGAIMAGYSTDAQIEAMLSVILAR